MMAASQEVLHSGMLEQLRPCTMQHLGLQSMRLGLLCGWRHCQRVEAGRHGVPEPDNGTAHELTREGKHDVSGC